MITECNRRQRRCLTRDEPKAKNSLATFMAGVDAIKEAHYIPR